MITTTVMRRVLAKLEAKAAREAEREGTPIEQNAHVHIARLAQGCGTFVADLARALNAETPAFTPNGLGASSTACDDQHTTARRL